MWNRETVLWFLLQKKSFDAEASRWVRSSVPFYRAIWLNRRQGILWEGLGLCFPTSVNLNMVVVFVWFDGCQGHVFNFEPPWNQSREFLLTSQMLLDEITLTILMYVGSSLGSALMYTLDALLTSQTEGLLESDCHGLSSIMSWSEWVKSQKWKMKRS